MKFGNPTSVNNIYKFVNANLVNKATAMKFCASTLKNTWYSCEVFTESFKGDWEKFVRVF